MLMGYGDLNLPYDVPANEFLTFEIEEIFQQPQLGGLVYRTTLSRYAPDPLRYLLSINMPETTDTDFSWREFYRRNNDELVATYGNLAHRVLTFTFKNYDESIPTPGELDKPSLEMLDKVEETLKTVDELLGQCHFKDASKRPWVWLRKLTVTWTIKPPGKPSNRIKRPPVPLYMWLLVSFPA